MAPLSWAIKVLQVPFCQPTAPSVMSLPPRRPYSERPGVSTILSGARWTFGEDVLDLTEFGNRTLSLWAPAVVVVVGVGNCNGQRCINLVGGGIGYLSPWAFVLLGRHNLVVGIFFDS